MIAEALLDAGILTEDGYVGSLRESVTMGLRGWLAGQDAENLSYFDGLAFMWTDDIERLGLGDTFDGWANWAVLQNNAADQGLSTDLGCFALVEPDGLTASVVGPRIEALMGIAGRATAWRVLRVLNSALRSSGIANTPASVRDMMEELGSDDDEGHADAIPDWAEVWDVMTSSRFDQGQPIEACQAAQPDDARLLRRARADLRRRFRRSLQAAESRVALTHGRLIDRGGFVDPGAAWAYNVIAVAADLGTLLERRADDLNQLGCFSELSCPGHLVRWSMCDNIPRVFDDYIEQLSRFEEGPTQVTSLVPFLPGLAGDGPGTLRHAAEALTELVPIVTLCDALIELLDEQDAAKNEGGEGTWPPGTARHKKGREKAGTPLMRLFAQEAAGTTFIEQMVNSRRRAPAARSGRERLLAQQTWMARTRDRLGIQEPLEAQQL